MSLATLNAIATQLRQQTGGVANRRVHSFENADKQIIPPRKLRDNEDAG